MPSRRSSDSEHVEAFVGDAEVIEDLHDLPGKSALRKLRRALHEQHHVVGLHFVVDELLDGHGSSVLLGGTSGAALTSIYVPEKSTATQERIEPEIQPAFRGVECALDLENIVLVERLTSTMVRGG